MIDIAALVSEFLEYKTSIGYSIRTYELFLTDFQQFFLERGCESFTEDTVLPWCEMRETESPAGFCRRLGPLREFSKYLCAMSISDYVVPRTIFPIVRRAVPYIFTDEELRQFFEECDRESPSSLNPCRHLIVRVIFRVIYLCGLRPNEGRELMRADFDPEAGTLLIRKNKTGRERIIPVSDDVGTMLEAYLGQSTLAAPNAEALFPSPTGKPYGRHWLGDTFRRIWTTSRPAADVPDAHVYDLRHRYATTVLTRWMEEGADIGARLPYLSAYMGHTSFSDTAYYIHLLPERLRVASGVDWDRMNALIPEVPHED